MFSKRLLMWKVDKHIELYDLAYFAHTLYIVNLMVEWKLSTQ